MNEMYKYLLNHNYISENKTSDSQKELSVERAECIANKFNSLIEEKATKIHDVLEYIYKNSIPIALTSNPPIHKLEFEGDINEVLRILKKVED